MSSLDTSQFSLTEQEKTAVYGFVRSMRPDDEQFQLQMAHFRGACLLVKKVFGSEWYEANLSPIFEKVRILLSSADHCRTKRSDSSIWGG